MNTNNNNKCVNPKGGRNRQERTETTFSGNLKLRRTKKIWHDQVEKYREEEDVDIQLDTKLANALRKFIAAVLREGADRVDGGQNPEEQTAGGDGFDAVK